MTVNELGQMVKSKHPEYSSVSDAELGARAAAKYPEYRLRIGRPSTEQNAESIEPGIYGETNPPEQKVLKNLNSFAGGYGVSQLGLALGRAGVNGVSKIAGKISDIRNAPQTLEDALGSISEKFGTSDTPSMIGNTARTGLESEQSAAEANAQRLYGQVPKDVPVSTPRMGSTYQELQDELPPNIKNAVNKHVQLEPNPVRPGDNGDFKGITEGSNYGIGYSASPGQPTQLPPNNPSVGDLIKLRSKLGAATRSGGIDGFNAGKLKAALDEDISNLGSGEGPLGKMTNDVVNENLGKATNYYREMMGQQSTPLYKKLATSKMEDIPDIIFKNGRTQDVLEARAALGEEGFQAAKKSFFNDIINSKDIGKTLTKYSQSNSDFLRAAFNPTELNSLKTVADLQKKALEAAKTADRAKMLITGAGAAAVGGGIAGSAIKFAAGKNLGQ